jgi:hypothetical protein
MELIESLTPEIRSVVRKFCSHPTADALRKTVAAWGDYSGILPEDETYPDANTFYIYYFTSRKLTNIMDAIERIQALSGADVRVSEYALRPSLWPLYAQAFPNYFHDCHFHSDHIDYDADDYLYSEMEEGGDDETN